MRPFFLIPILIALTILWGCKKTASQSTLDLSQQWQTDVSGSLIKGVSNPKDSQWQNRLLTSSELALFNSLDTADLSGTTMPGSIQSTIFYPNPFLTQALMYFKLNSTYQGQFKLKYVIVDNHMNALQKGSSLLSNSYAFFLLTSSLPSGYYRIYFTLSSQTNENFYTSWGNIQKSQ